MQSEQIAGSGSQKIKTRVAALRCLAIVPAYNEEATVAQVIREIRSSNEDFDVLVVDDGSADRTEEEALAEGARVVRLPYNLGIGGAVQTGLQYAHEHGFDVAVQVDGDAQHDPAEIPKVLAPIIEGNADLVVGSRFLGEGEYEPPVTRLLGIRLLARVVSLLVRQRVTDTTSGFRASNRRAISLFASDYPHDYPEVEAMVLVFRHRLKLVEVPVQMRLRGAGESSITFWRSAYYMLKVLLALFVGLFRRYPTPQEDHQ
jgi:glycosyltransferase involved in cell wall biosynthesis